MSRRTRLVATGISTDAAALDVDIVVPAGQVAVIYNIDIGNESNVEVTQPTATLECPPATTVFTVTCPFSINFGEQGWQVPNAAAGDDVQLTIAAAAAGLKTTGLIIYELIDDPGTL